GSGAGEGEGAGAGELRGGAAGVLGLRRPAAPPGRGSRPTSTRATRPPPAAAGALPLGRGLLRAVLLQIVLPLVADFLCRGERGRREHDRADDQIARLRRRGLDGGLAIDVAGAAPGYTISCV